MFGSIALWFDDDSSDSENDCPLPSKSIVVNQKSSENLKSEKKKIDKFENARLWRKLRDNTNLFEIPEEKFLAKFRVSKEIFSMLLKEMEPRMRVAHRTTHMPSTSKLATFLTFIGRGGYQVSIGKRRGSSMSTTQVSRVINECLEIFDQHVRPKWINFNRETEEETIEKEEFYKIAGIPGVVGCVDATLVRIKAPSFDERAYYYNSKGFCAINAVVICDHNMKIIFVDANNPGSTSDALIWESSVANYCFKSNFEDGKDNTWLLGDSGFKLQPYMMTPYQNPTTDQQIKFNECHNKTHNIIRTCLGMVKKRFRCISGKKSLHYSPQKAAQIANACCALHNICISYKSDWSHSVPTDNDVEEPIDLPAAEENTVACTIRDEIAKDLSLV